MAGDWIKMRCNLWDDPRVAQLCDLTSRGEAEIIGGLYWLWASTDQHSEDGIMPGLSAKSIDRKTGIKGLGDALLEIGWLADHPEGVRIVRFEEHNGRSAKRRCSESVRKMSARDADNVRTESGNAADEVQQSCAPREEKRREEVNHSSTSSTRSTSDGSQATRPASKRATQLPADFEPDGTGADYAAARHLNTAAELEAFRNHHTAKGTTFKSWQAAWRTWCDKAVQFGRAGQAPNARASPRATAAQEREQVSMVLTGRKAGDGQGGSGGGRERDITGEAVRVA